MKFIVSSASLLKNLQLISGVIGTNTVLPILQDFLFEINNSELTVSGTDLESLMQVKLEVECTGKKRFCIPAQMLMNTLRNISNQPLTFDVDDKLNVKFTSENGKYNIPCENADDFPKEPQAKNTTSFSIPANVLTNAIAKTLIAVSKEDIRPAMTGVYFELTKESIQFVSTDAHRLIKYQRTDVECPEDGGFIVPRKSLNLIKNLFDTEAGGLSISYNPSHLFIIQENIQMSCRLIDAKFPDYKVVLPTDNPFKLTLVKSDFQQALRRLSIFSNKSTHLVVLKIAGSELQMTAQDVDLNFEGNERMNCKYDGEDMTISFNALSLLELLGAIDSDEIVFELAGHNKASILKQSENEANEDLVMLAMPFMVS